VFEEVNLEKIYSFLSTFPYLATALLIALTLHEFAHGYVAYLFGDPTAKREGRLTLNPLRHLDLIGTLMIFLIGFGWAKPVPINQYNFRNPRLAGVLVSLAGPLSNLFLCFLFLAIYQLAIPYKSTVVETFFGTNILLNATLFLFNLIPLPPLDGYRIIEFLVATKYREKLQQYEMYGVVFFLLLAVTPLGNYVFTPIFEKLQPELINLLNSMIV
jgi:Zn-dependent protease